MKKTNYFDLTELSARVADMLGLDESDVRATLVAAGAEISGELGRGEYDNVVLDNIGTFHLKGYSSRKISAFGKDTDVPPCYRVRFKAAQAFRDTVAANLPEERKHIEVRK